ncbi:MAG TPA: hypothetical protein VN937_01385 [Blastocatellia bacterium]|nr:hypothetical protein [Blastocatellia bacterium]
MKSNLLKAILLNIALTVGLTVNITANAAGQDKTEQAKAEAAPQPQQVKSGRQDLGPTADSIRPYRMSGRDPFKKTVKPKTAKGKQQAHLLGFPSLDVRRAEFRQKIDQARARDGAEPDPVSQYLVSELEITGVFRDDRGFGAFVRAQPSGTMFFVRNGARCYNGEVMRITGDGSDSAGAKVLFREVSYMELNGKRSPQEQVVTKSPVDKK